MKVGVVLLAALLLAGCDPVVKTERTYVGRVEGQTSCTHFGYCYACGLNAFNHKFECSMAWKYSCPGEQPAVLDVWRVRETTESGKLFDSRQTSVVSRSGECR